MYDSNNKKYDNKFCNLDYNDKRRETQIKFLSTVERKYFCYNLHIKQFCKNYAFKIVETTCFTISSKLASVFDSISANLEAPS